MTDGWRQRPHYPKRQQCLLTLKTVAVIANPRSVIASEARQSRRSHLTAVRLRSTPAPVRPSVEIAASLALLAMTDGWRQRPHYPKRQQCLLTLKTVAVIANPRSVIASEARQSRRSHLTAVRLRSTPAPVRPGIGIAASLALLAMTVAVIAGPSLTVIARPKAAAISSTATNARSPRHRDCRVAGAPRNDNCCHREPFLDCHCEPTLNCHCERSAAISSVASNGGSPPLHPGARSPRHRDCRVTVVLRHDRLLRPPS